MPETGMSSSVRAGAPRESAAPGYSGLLIGEIGIWLLVRSIHRELNTL